MGADNSTLASRPWKDGKDYWCSFELYPEWKGNMFYVFKGVACHRRDYTTATEVAVKTFRHFDATSNEWRLYIGICALARKMATNFNAHLTSIGITFMVLFVTPVDVVMDNISDVMPLTRLIMRFKKSFSQNEKVVFEDFLECDFKTFISSTGITCEEGSDILESFCHFVYHQSDGELVLGNLKGVLKNSCFRLTCPAVHSRSGTFGDEDRGEAGIKEFFSNHVCKRVCKGFVKPDRFSQSVVPSAPQYSKHWDHTGAKEPCGRNTSRDQEKVPSDFEFVSEPPKYETVDPYQPPPYDSCI